MRKKNERTERSKFFQILIPRYVMIAKSMDVIVPVPVEVGRNIKNAAGDEKMEKLKVDLEEIGEHMQN